MACPIPQSGHNHAFCPPIIMAQNYTTQRQSVAANILMTHYANHDT